MKVLERSSPEKKVGAQAGKPGKRKSKSKNKKSPSPVRFEIPMKKIHEYQSRSTVQEVARPRIYVDAASSEMKPDEYATKASNPRSKYLNITH